MGKYTSALITILGLSFWFFLAFPFANHNESYTWVVQLNGLGFLDALSKQIYPVANYRPLGQAIAWLGYHLSGKSIYPVQLFNYIVAALSWIVLLFAVKEKRLLSLIALTVGGFFFSGYLYLFHLHGVFYSPLLLLVAATFFLYEDIFKISKIISLAILSILISLFHPFALLIYLAFILGMLIEKRERITRTHLIVILSFVILAAALIKVLIPGSNLPLRHHNLLGLLVSYRMTEVNLILSIIAFLLSIITAASIDISLRNKKKLTVLVVILSLLSFWIAKPIVIVWIFVCLVKTVLMRKWAIAFLLIATFLLPLPGSGSPTYSVFVLMVCAAVSSWSWAALENRLRFVNHWVALSLPLFALAIVICLRCNVSLPVISRLAKPILAEKEKTFQLETIIDWMIKSQYNEYDLVLNQPAGNPRESHNSMNRIHRPPTQQQSLNAYIDSFRLPRHADNNTKNRLLVCFGNENIENAKQAYIVKSKYAGNAIVYLPME